MGKCFPTKNRDCDERCGEWKLGEELIRWVAVRLEPGGCGYFDDCGPQI